MLSGTSIVRDDISPLLEARPMDVELGYSFIKLFELLQARAGSPETNGPCPPATIAISAGPAAHSKSKNDRSMISLQFHVLGAANNSIHRSRRWMRFSREGGIHRVDEVSFRWLAQSLRRVGLLQLRRLAWRMMDAEIRNRWRPRNRRRPARTW